MDRVAFTRNTLRDFVSHLAFRVCDDNIVRCREEHVCHFTLCAERFTRTRRTQNQTVRVFELFAVCHNHVVGRQILLDLLKEKNIDLSSVHQDCGLLIYDNQKQDTHSGGSGCGCAASVLAAYILPRVVSGFWKRVLFVPTGAMLSKVSFNEGESVAGIAHGVVIEHISKETEV